MSATQNPTVPAIGQIWPGQGGIYAGVARGHGQADNHVILAVVASDKAMNWQGCATWAASVEADGHADFSLPDRWESALLYANLQDQIDTSDWYWTGSEYSASSAWCQFFVNGDQCISYRGDKARCRAVRRFPVNPSVLSISRAAVEQEG